MKIVQPNAQEIVRDVTRDFVNFVGKTYGPAAKSVLIQNNFNVRAVDDGKSVSEDYELKNEVENAVAMYIKEALSKTDARVGDGTTTAAILTGAIVSQIFPESEILAKDPAKEVPVIKEALKEAVAQIEKASKEVKTKEELYKVAYNSYNNEEIAHLIAETVFKVGKDGIVSVEDSQTVNTEAEVVQGTELQKGYVSPYFVNDGEKVTLKNPSILLVNGRLESAKDLLPLLQKFAQSGKKELMVVAEGFGEEVLGNFILTKIQGVLRPLLVENPMFGEHRLDFLQDLVAVCGGQIVDEKTAVDLKTLSLEDLGSATSVVAKKDNTVITGGKGNKKDIQDQVATLKARLEATTNGFEKDKLSKRIAVLNGGVAVIKIGADTEHEQKTKKLKAEDAVNAARVAFKNGVVEGAGKTYEKIKTKSEVLNNALKAPRAKLIENGEELLDEKVVDPTSVLIAALESAVSIATGLVTMSGIIATKREEKDK